MSNGIPLRILAVQIEDTGYESDKKRQICQKSGGDMDIEYFLNDTHCFFNGRIEKDGIQRDQHQHVGKKLKRYPKGLRALQDYSSRIYAKVKYETSRKIRSKATRIFSQGNTN